MNGSDLRGSAEFAALRAVAARLGHDPLQIQGPGGNVSLKAGGVMLVKASGTWLADAQQEDIFAQVDAAAMKAALLQGDASAEQPERFLLSGALRPSIETSFHAALDAPAVLHTHCVATLARSTRPIPQAELDALGLVSVPYYKPGADLARAVIAAWRPGNKGVVLGNHGLIAVGETVAAAETVVRAAAAHFDCGPVARAAPAEGFAASLEGTGWRALGPGATTALAFHPERLAEAVKPALFPDQVIFIGPNPLSLEPGQALPQPEPASLVFVPGQGAAIPEEATPACQALAEMMGEVVFRLPDNPARLTQEEIGALLGWDAEKHRQELEKARSARLAGSPS